MNAYKYEIQNSPGHVSSGVIQASSIAEASNALCAQGYLLNIAPTTVTASSVLERLRKLNVQSGPGIKDVMSFTTQMAVMIKAGINIRNAISGIADQTANLKFKKMLDRIKSDVESGKPFSEALGRYPKVFSPLYVNMVKAGEISGNFGHMLDRIAAYVYQQVETRSMVRGAIIYPGIIATLAVGATIFLLTFVLPTFTKLFEGKEALLPKPTKLLIALSTFMRTYWYLLLGGLGAFIWGFIYYIRTRIGQRHWDYAKLKIPLLKNMLRALYISRGLQTMGELVNAGVPMLETLTITADVSGNSLYAGMWQNVHEQVKQGNKIAQPLQKQNLLPRNVVQMIAAGEESGKLGEVLHDVAEYYCNELKNTIKAVTAMIEPIMIVLMGAVVGFIAMSIILPIFKMSSLVK